MLEFDGAREAAINGVATAAAGETNTLVGHSKEETSKQNMKCTGGK